MLIQIGPGSEMPAVGMFGPCAFGERTGTEKVKFQWKSPRHNCEGNRDRPSRQTHGHLEKLGEGGAVRLANGLVMKRERGLRAHGSS